MSPPTVILGAGLAGLSCARHLRGPYEIYERSDAVGGAARTFERGKFRFDVTGHWLHLRDDAVKALVQELLGDELVSVERRAAIFSHGVWTPYPFQANTHGLPTQVVADCVLGYFRAREEQASGDAPPARSFEDYIRQRMGDGIADHFMLPYNQKLWTVPASEMSHEWCGRFVPIPKPEEVVNGALQPAGAGHGLGYNASFLYPRAGGIGRLGEALGASLKHDIALDHAAENIDAAQKRVRFANGHETGYDNLVSTLPLNALIDRLSDVPDAIKDARHRLRATSVTYWDIGVPGANRPSDPHWSYFPDPDLPFYRAGSASAAVPYLAPENHRSFYVEVAHPQGTPCGVSDQEILDGLRRVGLLDAGEEPVVMERIMVDCAYVIMDHAYGEARREIMQWLATQQIQSVGRWGDWTYDSMEGAIVQGREAAAKIPAKT